MPDTLQRRPLDAASAGVSGCQRDRSTRRRSATGRDWAPTPLQPTALPVQRVPPEAAPVRGRGCGQQRDWTPTPVMLPLPPGLLPVPRRHGKDLDAAHGECPEAAPAATSSARGRFGRIVSLILVNVVALTSVGLFVGLAIGPRTGDYRTLSMLTGSMRPQFPSGSVVVVTPLDVDDLRPGHVITYNAPIPDRRVVTHRVVSIDRTGESPVIVTKGDANAGDDPWEAVLNDDHVWQARFAIPFLGDGIRLLRQPNAQLIATRVVPGAMLLWLIVSIWRSGDSDA